MKQKCWIIIDGSNFYFKLKDLGLYNLLAFDFTKFVKLLGGSNKIVQVCYYVGRIRQDGTKKTNELFNAQQKLLGSLKKHKIAYQFGYLLKSDGVYHEKGVDVQMAVDMVAAAFEKTCNRIILVSSDTDLAPAIKKAREKGMVVEYAGFSHQPSIAMVGFCTESTLLKKEDLVSFLPAKKKQRHGTPDQN
ncbi:hypothetical protein A2W24_00665 [Microgenomates group bacterium RBG_16_45_19]|nr:MAG: hypothetical protein A2W24_00665 [Microgenomates group bacterium RBG_16_45_19]